MSLNARYSVISILLSCALSGCMSLSDFTAMTPDERGIVVCGNADEIKAIKKDISRYTQAVSESKTKIADGFATKHVCFWKEIEDGFDTDCWKDKRGNSHCETRPRIRSVEVCEDIMYPIDIEVEKEKLDEAEVSLMTARRVLDQTLRVCRKRVSAMSPEQAFAYYEHDTMPRR